jgi:hypothetical protein
MKPLAVIDIDGTVADARHRLHLIADPTAGRNEWIAFFDAAAADPPIVEGVAAARKLEEDCEIVWLTARPERVRTLTRTWLDEHGLAFGTLLMKPRAVRSSARHYKLSVIRRLSLGRDVVAVLDDDPRVVAVLDEAGLPAEHVAWSTGQPRGTLRMSAATSS